jgi:hypothetical protein
MSLLGRFFRFLSKGLIKGHIKTATSPAIEDGATWHGNRQHFLKTHRLGTELDQIAVIRFWFAPLVLYRKRQPGVLVEPMKFHDVGFPDQAESQRPQWKAIFNPNIPPGLPVLLMDPFMHDPTFSRRPIFIPELLDVDEGALSLAKGDVLKSRDHDKILF